MASSFTPPTFEQLYADIDHDVVSSLMAFRREQPLKHVDEGGTRWNYVSLGRGDESVLFLHGMGGAYDIWWRQIDALKARYRVLSATYPPVHDLESLRHGIATILDREQITHVNVIGTSLGGYLAQYLIARHHDLVQRVIFGNTFPPNEVIRRNTRWIGKLLPLLPERFVMRSFRQTIANELYPASGYSPLVRAFLLEQSYGLMSKAQFVGRYHCVIEQFTPPNLHEREIPALIVESDNDPSVAPALRERLKTTYPSAAVHTLQAAGHFPYLNQPEQYTQLITQFLGK